MPNEYRPYAALAFAIVEKAVADVRMLCDMGLIVDGEARDPFPDRYSKESKASYGYNRQHEVRDLIVFLRCGAAAEFLDMLGVSVTADEVCRKIGLGKEKQGSAI